MAARPVISMHNVTKVYEVGAVRVAALRGVSLIIQRGEYVAIMGASGSGKSTLMNILGCLDVPTTGHYLLDGVDVRRLDENSLARIRNGKIGFVFQTYNLIPRNSALRNVEMPLAYAGVGPRERRHLALEGLRRVGLANRAGHLPTELSGGQQQRVAIARALANDPPLILADEPTGNLDSSSSEEILKVFDSVNARGHTVVMITHEVAVANRCRRVVQLRDGQVIEDRQTAAAGERTASP
jgi:putative ABC transport system ATP-binding protein